MRRICVFCGSALGARREYERAAAAFGRALAARGLGLVYGGGNVGLMGALADATLAAGGEAIGIIPRSLVEREVAHSALTDLRIVTSMHERKALMAELSDGFVALPGGLGTLEELFEVWTWAQLGLHQKPCGVLDVDGYFGPLIAFLDHAVSERFVGAPHRAMLHVEADAATLLDRFAAYVPPTVPKWIEPSTT
jgi:uncharacterized protein (TIGR00730 family)